MAGLPDVIGLVFDEREYSAARLAALAGGLAGTLTRRGVQPGDRVALMASNRPEWLVAVQAVWRLGAAVVLFSPAWKRAETEHALAVTEPAFAVGDHQVLGGLMPMLHLDEPITPDEEPGQEPALGADAVLVFSSGTTGMPKAVRHTHASLRAAVRHWRDALGLTAADRLQITTPPSHILGLLNIVTCLETGAWMRLHRRFDLDRMLSCIEADRITVEMAVAPIELALVLTPADLLGAARGAHALACGYAKDRRQYGQAIGSYQAVAHPLAEGLALIEGSVSVLRHAAWAVDALPPDEAVGAARIAKVYCTRAARDICETTVQVHGGIGNTWEMPGPRLPAAGAGLGGAVRRAPGGDRQGGNRQQPQLPLGGWS